MLDSRRALPGFGPVLERWAQLKRNKRRLYGRTPPPPAKCPPVLRGNGPVFWSKAGVDRGAWTPRRRLHQVLASALGEKPSLHSPAHLRRDFFVGFRLLFLLPRDGVRCRSTCLPPKLDREIGFGRLQVLEPKTLDARLARHGDFTDLSLHGTGFGFAGYQTPAISSQTAFGF